VSLATFEDANVHLDGKKIEFLNEEDATGEALATDRYIRGILGSAFGNEIVIDWDSDPSGGQSATPELVRQAAAFLMAHYRYSKIYSEEALAQNGYAMYLKTQADAILMGLVDGTLELVDVPGGSGTTDVSQPSFFPDDSYVDLDTLEPIRMFSVEQEF
jgi:hypothetical protein